MTQPLPRFYQDILAAQDRAFIAEITNTPDQEPDNEKHYDPTRGGDHMRMRGVPITAEGVGGTSPGTDPPSYAIWNEHRLKGKAA